MSFRFAMKRIMSCSEVGNEEQKLLGKLDSPYITKLVDKFFEDNNYYFVMDYCEVISC